EGVQLDYFAIESFISAGKSRKYREVTSEGANDTVCPLCYTQLIVQWVTSQPPEVWQRQIMREDIGCRISGYISMVTSRFRLLRVGNELEPVVFREIVNSARHGYALANAGLIPDEAC
ncbi:MAG: hypothetical protein ACU833_09175, partial [Gammaproteobacteria bacterium]